MSLAELLIAALLTASVMGGVLSAVADSQRAFLAQAEAVDASQRLRVVVDTLTRELQLASAVSLTHRGEARADAITIRQGASVRAYYLADSQLRQDDGGQTAPVVDGVRSLRFAYVESQGAPYVRVEVVVSPRYGPDVKTMVGVALRNAGPADGR